MNAMMLQPAAVMQGLQTCTWYSDCSYVCRVVRNSRSNSTWRQAPQIVYDYPPTFRNLFKTRIVAVSTCCAQHVCNVVIPGRIYCCAMSPKALVAAAV